MTPSEVYRANAENTFLGGLKRVVTPPFDGLSIVLWSYFVLSYLALPHNATWRGSLPDPDDFTYLSQTLDWLQGQGWFDNFQHRMSPPSGVPIHYTRIAELPIASLILFFRAFHYSWRGAALLASFTLPLIYLAAFFKVLQVSSSTLVGPPWRGAIGFVALFAPALMFKFAPGQVDHHGLEAILTTAAFGFSTAMFRRPEFKYFAMGAGAALALALTIALETLPWVCLIALFIGFWCAVEGKRAAQSTAAFGLSLVSVSFASLIVCRDPTLPWTNDLLAYSISYVYLTSAIAFGLCAAAAVSFLKVAKTRLFLLSIVTGTLAILFLWKFPQLLRGPYGAMDPVLSKLFFDNLEEATPLFVHYSPFKGILLVATPALGLYASLTFFLRSSGALRWGWILNTALLIGALALTIFYQIRVLIYALLFSLVPLTALLEHGAACIKQRLTGRSQFWAEIGLVLLVGPLTSVLIPALYDSRSFNAGVMMFPAQSFDDSCDLHEIEALLMQPPYAARHLRIVNMIDQGPDLLFNTSHDVMSAPYHTNVNGNLQALSFFSTTDIRHAEEIVRQNHIDTVVMCRRIPDMYFHDPGPHYAVAPGGQLAMRPDPSLAGQLMQHKIPTWLSPVPVPEGANFLVFDVK